MNCALVPYQPPATCSARVGHSRSFAEWVRRGGRGNPIDLSADVDDVEALPTRGGGSKSARMAKTQAKCMFAAVVMGFIIILFIFGGVGVVLWRVDANMARFEGFIRPHASHILNQTLDILSDTGGSLHNVNKITQYTSELASVAGGDSGSASATLNATAHIAQQLENFLHHPTLQLSLGGGSST